MAITADRLIALLDGAPDIDEWIATETRTRRVGRDTGGGRPARRSCDTVELGAVVFRDSERGRGVARLWIDADSADEAQVRGLIARAAERAPLALGPGWALPAPAAPARVAVADPDIVAEPVGVVDAAVAQLGKADGRLCRVARARVDAEWRSHRAETSRGFASHYQSTALELDASIGPLAGPGRALLERAHTRVRSAAQLLVHRRAADAARRAAWRAGARPLEAGRYDVLLSPSALAGPLAELEPSSDAAGYGWFAPLVAHADAGWVRLGISRYRPGQSVFHPPVGDDAVLDAVAGGRTGRGGRGAGREGDGDPLTLASDGTLAFAPLSAPFGDLGEPVRRFELVRAGAAAGLSLDYRESVLARTTPNGGVRNLVLSPGPNAAARLAEPGRDRLLAIDQLAWIDVDPRSGALTAGIRLGEVRGGGAGPVRVSGGLLVGNAFALLARARLSSEVGSLGWYRGPTAVRIDGVDLVAG